MKLTEMYVQKKIQGGDIREFELLFNKYYTPLCFHAFQYTHDMDVAEDIVQEFFYNFWKNHQTIAIKLSLQSYLYQSVRLNAIQYMQRKSVHMMQNADFVNEVSNEGTDASSRFELQELTDAIKSTLQKLPHRAALIFKMNRFEGKKYQEIAESLSVSVKTVEADMGKVLKVFRKTLVEYGIDKTSKNTKKLNNHASNSIKS